MHLYCPNSFCGVCYVLLHAPPSLCPHFTLCLTRVLRTLLFKCFVCVALFCPACVSALLCWGSCLCPSCLPCPAVSLLYVLRSSLHPGALVPPSGYLVAAVTALLPCFHAGSVVELCFLPSFGSWQQRLLALCGVFTLYTMSLVTSGSLVRPYSLGEW